MLCQALGWLSFMGLQLMVLGYFAHLLSWSVTCATVQNVTLGVLVTHAMRHFLTQWGWKELSWPALVPRILGMALAGSLVWTGVQYGLLRILGTGNPSRVALVGLSVINGVVIIGGWLGVYFFYHLFDRFNRLRIEQLRLGAVVKEAELRALKSQINPHFIFNSLNSLRALIDEDPARARQAVTQLANLLRYSLQSGQLETVPFEEELGIVNDYLALELVRHEERLRLRLDVAPDTLQLPVPPMLLQTLVENAVKYGISRRPEGGEIAIVARCDRGMLRIQVTNPGELAVPAAGAPVSTGVGLRNAAERLRLLFGESATLQLRAAAPGLVVAEAAIPSQLRP